MEAGAHTKNIIIIIIGENEKRRKRREEKVDCFFFSELILCDKTINKLRIHIS